jgi:hypothetical protein
LRKTNGATRIRHSITTGFWTPVDLTLPEVAVESFFPADRAARDTLGGVADGGTSRGERRAWPNARLPALFPE